MTPYGWMIEGSTQIWLAEHGPYAESAAIAEAKRIGGTCHAYPIYREPYDQQAMELCPACGWKAIIPGEPCFVCNMHIKQEPMTTEQITNAWDSVNWTAFGYAPFARAIEAHHGITQGAKP